MSISFHFFNIRRRLYILLAVILDMDCIILGLLVDGLCFNIFLEYYDFPSSVSHLFWSIVVSHIECLLIFIGAEGECTSYFLLRL